MYTIKNLFTFLMITQTACMLYTKTPITLFSHGIVDNQTQMDRYEDCIQEPKQSFNFEDAQSPEGWNLNNFVFQTCSLFKKPVNRDKMYMGYGQDIETLKNQVNPDETYILYGLSRGGATVINYLAKYNPTNIVAIVLDSAPADVVASSSDALQYLTGYNLTPDRITQETIFQTMFPAYPLGSIPPVESIQNITYKELPIFIVHSYEDSRVHISSAWQLYLAFIQAGFKHVYLCELNTGKHGFYLQGSDKEIYLHALHSFYKHYHLPYNKTFADVDITTLQPSQETIQAKLNAYQEKLATQYNMRQSQIQNLSILSVGIALLSRLRYFYNPH